MTARPPLATKSKRPTSAIFIGNLTQLPALPALPSSPASSGLPSPPSTNSTGSGSNGDNDSSAGSVRIPASLVMKNGSKTCSGQRSASRSSSDEGDEANDEDHTAKVGLAFRANTDDSQSALQRVKSLTQRNRLVLNKLASISSGSRLSTPSPNPIKRFSHSPTPSSAKSTSSFSRVSNSSARRRSESLSRASGSETEREHLHNAASSSEDLSETPPSTSTSHFRSASIKERRASALIAQSTDSVHPSPRERPAGPSENFATGKRMLRPESRSGEIEAAALAAVANSRRRSPSDTRRRQPLPREFRSGKPNHDDYKPREPPSTPRRGSDRASDRGSPSSRTARLNDSPQSPRPKPQRYSTVREIAKKNQSRWLSQDLTSPPRGIPDEDGRTQARREGSGEGLLQLGGRSVVGESLRAAGLTRRREDGFDVFGGGEINRRARLSSDIGARPAGTPVEATRADTRFSDRPLSSDCVANLEPRTPANPKQSLAQRHALTVQADRPSTSMAAFRDEPRTAPPLRTYKTAYQIPEKEHLAEDYSRPSSQARNVYPISSAAASERVNVSTLGQRTSQLNLASAAAAAASDSGPDHTRLMLDSLSMFESQLARLPSMGSTTTVTIPELFRSAQNIVHATNALNNLLRNGTAHALEEQIDAELGETGHGIDLVKLWRDVGADYRESVRVSDELVRTMTSFLLGVGKVLRETMADKPHSRTISLDDSITRRLTPDIALSGNRKSDKLSSDGGRSSIDGKRRWDGSSGEMGRTTTSFTSLQSSLSASLHNPASSRASTASERLAEAEPDVRTSESLSDTSAKRLAGLSFTTSRRLESLQDLRDAQVRDAQVRDSRVRDYTPAMQTSYLDEDAPPDDSPLAAVSAARQQGTLPRRANTVATPPSLPTLLSESLLARQSSSKAASVSRHAKMSTTSNTTVRAASSMFPSVASSGEPTTAVNTTQASPERPSLRSAATVTRTLSRSSAAALAGLQQQMELDKRKRTISASSALEGETRETRSGPDNERVVSRPRGSLDSSNIGTFTTRAGRDRRGTVTSLFTRT